MDFSVNFNAVVLKCTRIKSSDIKKTDDLPSVWQSKGFEVTNVDF